MTPSPTGSAYATRRARILDSAMTLFRTRGFDSVTVAEIAAAAGVTTKTVFNHFPRKEDLVFDRGDSYLLQLTAALDARDDAEPITEPLHRAVIRQIEASSAEAATLVTLAWLTTGSASLQRRLTEDFDKLAQHVAAQLIARNPTLEAGGLAAALAGALVSVQRLVLTELGESLAAGVPIERAQSDAYRAAAAGYAILRDGFGATDL